VDEACSLGQIGVRGHGVEEHFGLPGSIDVRTGTLAKALGTNGGYVACSAAIAQRLRFQRGASLSTSLSPLNAFIAWHGTQILQSEGAALTARLARNAAVWREELTSIGFRIGRSTTAIVPIMCDDDDGVAALFQQAIDRGIYALPVSWPWSARMHALRSTVTAVHDADRLREIAGRLASARDPGFRAGRSG
jgi:7-keto-8-aminopelargonate synthetase-like enzyme